MLQQGEQQRRQRENEANAMEANAAQMEYSPWTGVKSQMMGPQSAGGSGQILGAGAQGAMMGAMFNQQNAGPTKQQKMMENTQYAQNYKNAYGTLPKQSLWSQME